MFSLTFTDLIKFDLAKASQKIGVEISPEMAKDLLEKLEFEVTLPKTKGNQIISFNKYYILIQ